MNCNIFIPTHLMNKILEFISIKKCNNNYMHLVCKEWYKKSNCTMIKKHGFNYCMIHKNILLPYGYLYTTKPRITVKIFRDIIQKRKNQTYHFYCYDVKKHKNYFLILLKIILPFLL